MAYRVFAAAVILLAGATMGLGHGDVAPQPVNTEALPDVGEEWLIENPYRDQGEEVWTTAVEVDGLDSAGATLLIVNAS